MSQSYRQISAQLARRIKLAMADVDGILTDGRDISNPMITGLIRRLEEMGVVVGLVSGRTLSRLEKMARELNITGPIIAENGGVARLKVDSELLELGHSRQPALDALETLKRLYPGAIKEREDNLERLIDVVMWAYGVEVSDLRNHLSNTQFLGQGTPQLLDSGYILHLMQAGISKGKTLQRLLEMSPYNDLSADNVITFGDYLTDISLFELFPNSVFIPSPRLTAENKEKLDAVAGYISDHSIEEGFIEVVSHILDARAR